jgi:hypothetical protein
MDVHETYRSWARRKQEAERLIDTLKIGQSLTYIVGGVEFSVERVASPFSDGPRYACYRDGVRLRVGLPGAYESDLLTHGEAASMLCICTPLPIHHNPEGNQY